jgi:hypothetical protein
LCPIVFASRTRGRSRLGHSIVILVEGAGLDTWRDPSLPLQSVQLHYRLLSAYFAHRVWQTNRTLFITSNNSQIANANFGSQIGTITASLSAVAPRGKAGQEFATALKTITEGVVNSDELDEQQKKSILEALELVGQEAEAPPDKRRRCVFEPVLESLPKLLSSASALVNLWHAFVPHIIGFFH